MNNSEIIIYSTPQGEIKIEVFLQGETVWLTQRSIGELFGVENRPLASILQISTKAENWKKLQLFGKSEQFKMKLEEK